MFWCEDKCQQEQQCLQNDDNSAGCAVQPVAQPGAEKAGQAADSYGDGEQAWKTIGQQPCRRSGRNHRANHQKCTDGLQCGDCGNGEQRKNSSFKRPGFKPIERAWFSSKKTTIRSFHFKNRIVSEITPMMASCRISSGAIAGDITENNGLDVHRHRIERHHKQPDTEERRKNQPDNRIFLQA